MKQKEINIADYSYNLPENKIAKYPVEKRDTSKLLLYKNKKISHDFFYNIDKYLPSESLIIANNTKVIHARLIFRKKTGSKIEIFCLNPHSPAEYNLAFAAKNKSHWQCIVGNLKKWKNEDLELTFTAENKVYTLTAKKIERIGNELLIEFSWNGSLTFGEVLEYTGKIPIPPYLNRDSENSDNLRYQTVYSKAEGSVAAPTAGLHFTENVFDKLHQKNIKFAEVTLHVGAGTFKPVKSEKIGGHDMHTEFFTVNKKTLSEIIKNSGKIISVGTTTLRTLESLYWLGTKLYHKLPDFNFISQWEVYNLPQISTEKALTTIIDYLDKNNLPEIQAHTKIIIVPGYKFKIANQLITNFHQPRSTLLLLVAAFVGEDWKNIYDYALNNDFRFLSYGDSSLLTRI